MADPGRSALGDLVRSPLGDLSKGNASHYIHAASYSTDSFVRGIRVSLDDEAGDDVVSTGQTLLTQRLQYAGASLDRPQSQAHLFRSGCDLCISVARALPRTLAQPSLVAIGGELFEGPYIARNAREIDGRPYVLYQQRIYDPISEGVSVGTHMFAVDYEDMADSMQEWIGGAPAILTYRGSLAADERDFTISLGSYSYVHTLNYPGTPGVHVMTQSVPLDPLETLVYTAASDAPPELQIGVWKVNGTAVVAPDLTAEITLQVQFYMGVTVFSLASIEAAVVSEDLISLLSLPEPGSSGPEDDRTTVVVDYRNGLPSWGILAFTATHQYHREEFSSDPGGIGDSGSESVDESTTALDARAYRVQIGASGAIEHSSLGVLPWETSGYNSHGRGATGRGGVYDLDVSYTGSYQRSGYPVDPWVNGEIRSIGEVAAYSYSQSYNGAQDHYEPEQFITTYTSQPVSTIYGIDCGNVNVALFGDVLWWFRDEDTNQLRMFLYDEEIAETDGALDVFQNEVGSVDGLGFYDITYIVTNRDYSMLQIYVPAPAFREGTEDKAETISSTAVDAPGAIYNRIDKTRYYLNVPGGLIIYWPDATPTRDGLCLLILTTSYSTFRTALRAALDIKAAGGDYQSALDTAIGMVSFSVNNFASWEFIASFAAQGTYYIVEK